MKTGIIICPPLLYPGKLVIVLFIYSYDGKPTICHTSPGRNGVPMIYREKACILPPVIIQALFTVTRSHLYSLFLLFIISFIRHKVRASRRRWSYTNHG